MTADHFLRRLQRNVQKKNEGDGVANTAPEEIPQDLGLDDLSIVAIRFFLH